VFVASKLFSKVFSGSSSKDAYTKMFKWIATEMMPTVDMKKVTFSFSKVKNADCPQIELVAYATFDDSENIKSICARCQEFHRLFYINAQFNCDKCNMMGYRSRMEDDLKIAKKCRKEEMGRNE
jgi:hypothetical protein